MRPTPEPPALEVYMLGLVDFAELQQLQRRIVYELGEQGGAALILCEHPPTISIGRSGSRAHIAADQELLQGMGIRTFYVNRGGGCVLHLPGQLAAYVLMPLEGVGLTVQAYVDRLHATIRQVLEEFDLSSASRPDLPGIFSGTSRLATVGIAVNRWIAYHGLTLNVGPYLELFDLLDEPGIGTAPCARRPWNRGGSGRCRCPRCANRSSGRSRKASDCDHSHLYTQHPQIRRKVLAHVYAPSPG